MRAKSAICLFCLTITLAAPAIGGDLPGKIRGAQCDIKVLAPSIKPEDIQWTALLYLNQTYGADIHVVIIRPSPEFGFKAVSCEDGQFHLTYLGRGAGMTDSAFADTVAKSVFEGIYPDLAVFGASDSKDSSTIVSFLREVQRISKSDSMALAPLDRIYARGTEISPASVVLNDEELYRRYEDKVKEIGDLFSVEGPLNYRPERFRRYFLLDRAEGAPLPGHDFVHGFDIFRLPDFIAEYLFEGPEQRNMLNRLGRYRSYMRAAQITWSGRMEQLQLLGAAFQELNWLIENMETGAGGLKQTRILPWAEKIHRKALLAVSEALGLDWMAHLEMRPTPFGKTAKLMLDMELTGSRRIELSYFKFHPQGRPAVIVDSISKIIDPHQKFYREYPVDLSGIDLADHVSESLLFSVEVVVEGLPIELYVPHREFIRQEVELKFLPGYAFLAPFTRDDMTALAQPFDWQIMIGKPYGSELSGELKIHTPDGIVVGSYDGNIFMPVGTTRKYLNIYLAAGRSMGEALRTVRATLAVSGQNVAETAADVQILPCRIAETRDVALVPDPEGRLEDFLRMIKASFQPFTEHSLIRASLEAYDVLIIGQSAERYYPTLRAVASRLREFVENGGEVVILGQPFGWPHDIFEFPIYTSLSTVGARPEFAEAEYSLFNKPYRVATSRLSSRMPKAGPLYPAIVGAGRELVAAGEHGSYLRVTKVGAGHLIYCGLPLLEMAAQLDSEAIHLLANLFSFENGN